jgi:hypothetical protein
VISTHRAGSIGTCFYLYPTQTTIISEWFQLGGRGSDLLPSDSVPWDLLLLFPTQTTLISEWVQLGGRGSDLHPPSGVTCDLLLPFAHFNFRVGSAWRPGQ